jgi:ribosomal protein L31E
VEIVQEIVSKHANANAKVRMENGFAFSMWKQP